MRKYILFFILFSTFCFCQNNIGIKFIDSIVKNIPNLKSNKELIKAYTNLSYEYASVDTEIGILYGKKALLLSNKINWKEGKSNALLNIGENYYSQGKYKEAFKKYKDALSYTKDILTIGKINRNIATTYNSLGDYPKATKYIFKSLKISETQKNEAEKAKNYNTIGLIYYYTNQTKKALFNFNKSLKINTKLNLKREICRNLQNIGGEYTDNYDNKNGIKYFNQSLLLATQIDFKESIAVNNFCLARLYVENEELDKAIFYIKNAKKNAGIIKNYRVYNTCLVVESEIYKIKSLVAKPSEKFDLINKSEVLLLESIEKSKLNKSLTNLSRSYKLLSDLYSIKKEDKIAKDYYVLYSEIKDSIYNSENKETIKNLEDKRTIDIGNKQIQLNKIKLENKEKQKWYFIGGIVLLTIIGSLLYYQSRNRRKTNDKLQILNTNLDLKNTELDQANKAKTRFFSILNHDLRGPVANLVFFLQLQKESPEMLDEQSIKRMQDKTMTGAENLLSSMEDILQWSKSQMENFKPQPQKIFVFSLFEDIKNHFDSEESVIISFENPNNIEINTDENYLKTIIRNLTGNSIKALITIDNPTIVWKTWQESTEDKENNRTFLSITDNGKGANEEEFKALYDDKEVVGIKTGLGLHLIRDLAKAIDCEVSVSTKINEGTTIVLKL